jgi:general stress protein 26
MNTWSEVIRHAVRVGPDCFMATVCPDGSPHVAVVSPGFINGFLVVATYSKSIKAMNIRAGSKVMFHWPVREETGNDMLLLRGEPRPVEDELRRRELWEVDCLPYDLDDWHAGPDDPTLLWIQITPTYASLHRNLGAEGSSRWRR